MAAPLSFRMFCVLPFQVPRVTLFSFSVPVDEVALLRCPKAQKQHTCFKLKPSFSCFSFKSIFPSFCGTVAGFCVIVWLHIHEYVCIWCGHHGTAAGLWGMVHPSHSCSAAIWRWMNEKWEVPIWAKPTFRVATQDQGEIYCLHSPSLTAKSYSSWESPFKHIRNVPQCLVRQKIPKCLNWK